MKRTSAAYTKVWCNIYGRLYITCSEEHRIKQFKIQKWMKTWCWKNTVQFVNTVPLVNDNRTSHLLLQIINWKKITKSKFVTLSLECVLSVRRIPHQTGWRLPMATNDKDLVGNCNWMIPPPLYLIALLSTSRRKMLRYCCSIYLSCYLPWCLCSPHEFQGTCLVVAFLWLDTVFATYRLFST